MAALPFILYLMCSLFLLAVTNRALDKAEASCEADSGKLAGEYGREVTGALIAKSIFLFAILCFGLIMSEFTDRSFVDNLVFSLLCAFVFGGAAGGIVGFTTGLAAYFGGLKLKKSAKPLVLITQAVLHVVIGLVILYVQTHKHQVTLWMTTG